MQIQDPISIELDPETINLLDETEAALAQVARSRPFNDDISSRISREFIPDRITASLNIEGINVSRRQTLLMMDAMTIDSNSSKNEVEIFNALKADEFVFELSKDMSRPLDAGSLRQIHGILQKDLLESAGSYRNANVEITGAKFQPPEATEVPHLIQQMIDVFHSSASRCHPLLISAWLHCTFTAIHPFEDGNGRTG
ncbi:MAG: Fic family protein [Paracoccus sp. (in: a-proteobacteria)]|uniref:Fic family protein n=1 Tax=Paracoccus sp. TaxID=267 RepID=UPI00405A0148